jgi:hypothetical protein
VGASGTRNRPTTTTIGARRYCNTQLESTVSMASRYKVERLAWSINYVGVETKNVDGSRERLHRDANCAAAVRGADVAVGEDLDAPFTEAFGYGTRKVSDKERNVLKFRQCCQL